MTEGKYPCTCQSLLCVGDQDLVKIVEFEPSTTSSTSTNNQQVELTRTSPTHTLPTRLGAGVASHPSQGQLNRSDAHSCTYSLGPVPKGWSVSVSSFYFIYHQVFSQIELGLNNFLDSIMWNVIWLFRGKWRFHAVETTYWNNVRISLMQQIDSLLWEHCSYYESIVHNAVDRYLAVSSLFMPWEHCSQRSGWIACRESIVRIAADR